MRSLPWRSQFANQPISLLVKFSQRCIGSPSHHRKVITSGRHAEISSIPDDDFAFLREINLTIMNFSRSGLNSANKAVIDIAFLMELIAKIAFFALFCPCSISAVSSLGNSIFWLIGSSRISLDECGILNRSTLDVSTSSRLSLTKAVIPANPWRLIVFEVLPRPFYLFPYLPCVL